MRGEHWIVRVARQAQIPNAAALRIAAETPIADAWASVMSTCKIGEDELARALALSLRLEVADLDTADRDAARLVPGALARRLGVLPLEDRDRKLAVATSDPFDPWAEQQIGFASGRVPLFCIAPPARIAAAIEAAYAPARDKPRSFDPPRDPRVKIVTEEPPPPQEAAAAPGEVEDEGPIINLTNMIMEDAVTKGASDIHLQPVPTGGVIRLRIDGVLRSGLTVPLPVLGRVISRIKIMSRLDISDKMRPQDGRAHVNIRGRKYDLRVSTVPVRGGEKAVIRILDPLKSGALDESGLPAREVQRLRRVLRNRDGILVVTGPTGSGKTTTMYAALREIATEDVNIMTVEDPVEYELPGLTQIQVDPKQGVTFQSALKAILRQDPDVIFVGEIRDGATAETAAQASLTGHLVLATVHANDAVGSVRRFLDLGLDAATIAETLRGALAQRLLRTLCTDCAQPIQGELTKAEAALAERYGVRPTMRLVGCEECGNSGYRGRRPVAELILPTPELLRLVASEASHQELMARAREDGLRSLLEGALDLVLEGLTTLAEVERVIGEEGPATAATGAALAAAAASAASASPQPANPAAPEPEAEPVREPAAEAAPAPAATPAAIPAPAAPEPAALPATAPAPAPVPAAAPAPVPEPVGARTGAPYPPEPDPERAPAAPPPPPPREEPPAWSPPAPAGGSPTTPPAWTAREPSFARPAPPEPSGPITAIPEWSDPDDVIGFPKALLVEDEPETRLFCRSLLESRGWKVEEAPDGATALFKLGREADWALVVLDLGLPDIDGLTLLRGARAIIQDARIAVIVLTGRADRDSELRAIQEGADDYIRKPIDPPIFLARSKAAWRRAKARPG